MLHTTTSMVTGYFQTSTADLFMYLLFKCYLVYRNVSQLLHQIICCLLVSFGSKAYIIIQCVAWSAETRGHEECVR